MKPSVEEVAEHSRPKWFHSDVKISIGRYTIRWLPAKCYEADGYGTLPIQTLCAEC
jgi:hypothetical protein